MASRSGTEEREGYAVAIAGLWPELSRTLRRLDQVASAPDAGGAELLPALQYRLHEAAELVYGIRPPPGHEEAHAELVDALEDARDLTAQVAECGPDDVLYSWRGALFRVRLALSQLAARPAARAPAAEVAAEEPGSIAAPLAGLTLAVVGTVSLTTGAALGPWPLCVAGVLALVAGLLVYRP